MPFVIYGILEYLRLADVEGVGGSPVDVVYHSFDHAGLRRRLDGNRDVGARLVVNQPRATKNGK